MRNGVSNDEVKSDEDKSLDDQGITASTRVIVWSVFLSCLVRNLLGCLARSSNRVQSRMRLIRTCVLRLPTMPTIVP